MAALLAAPLCHAEDIDLFLNNPLSDAARPNLLLMVDNAASNNSTITQMPGASGTDKLSMIKDVLHILTQPLTSPYFPSCTVPTDPDLPRVPAGCVTRAEVDTMIQRINIGLMILNPSSADKGGYVRSHIRPMNVAANRTALWNSISGGIPQANNAPYAKMMHEAYLYFGARPAYAGFSSALYDAGARNGANYRSPITDVCQPNYIILLGTGGPDSSEDNDAVALLRAANGVVSSDPIQFTPSNYTSNWTDEYARMMNRNDISNTLQGTQRATTYTIAIQSPLDNNYGNAPARSSRALLQSTALQGGGEYALGQDGQAVLMALLSAIRKMQPVNSVFAAVTLPVSVNVRGTFLNQVYMGQFRPDANGHPRWPGNLKQYQIGLNGDNPILVDRAGDPVEDTARGFLLPDITSFWTRNSSFWSFTSLPASDAPDGSIVEKGGVAQRLRTDLATSTGRDTRNLYTCNGTCVGGSRLDSVAFNTANSHASGPTVARLGAADAAERDALIEWVRGADNRNDENGNGVSTDSRAYIHGDLLHSRPAVVNYNRTSGNRDVVVYYGTNDGVFRAVKGGQNDADGFEKWGMVFPEFFGKLRTLRENNTVIGVSTAKPYFADGPVSVYQHDVNNDGRLVAADGDKVYLYIGMRRGGQFMYALDVSDPDVPRFMWKIDDSMANFSSLGQTWSTVRPAIIRASTDPVLIFGGGYDPNNEDPQPAASGNSMGQGIYVVNALNGNFIKHINPAGMGAIVADVTVLDRDSDGLADRIYAPDVKGNVWRIDIDNALPNSWQAFKVASLGGTGADARKLLNKIDVVFGRTFDALLVGSGDREHPFETNVVDRFYMIQDTFVGLSGGLSCGTTAVPATCLSSDLTDVTSNQLQGSTLPSTSRGWYINFGSGEKLVSSPLTVFGAVIFSTNQPDPDTSGTSCGNLGIARLYQVDIRNGGAAHDRNADGVVNAADRYEVIPGGGFLPSAVYSPIELGGRRRDVVCVGTHCFRPPGKGFDTRRYRTYWYKK